MKKSIAKNYFYNLIYQMLTILLPFITTPYISRILGAESIGIYGYTVSIVTYFILFGSLGTAMYGQREIAYKAQSKKDVTKAFWEIVLIRTVTLIISIILFYSIYGRTGEYAIYYKILAIQLLANIFDISWFFQGIEEFDKTVIRNLVIKALCLLLIFVLIKTPNDLWKYFAIYVGSELIGNLSIWIYIPKYTTKIKIKELEFNKHIQPTLALFVPQIAIQIYTVLDKTMIGIITKDMAEVGYYEQAQKIVRAALMLITALQTVMNSRIANAYSNNDNKEIKECLKKSFNFIWFLAIPMMFGLIGIAPKFVPWFYGDGFEKVSSVIIATVPILIAIGLNGITGIQYLIQVGKQNKFTLSVSIGAVCNLLLNIIFIKVFGSIGAAIASVCAELIIFIAQLRYFKEQFNILEILKLSIKCWISGIIMFISIFLLSLKLDISIINTIIEILVGGIIYIALLITLRYKFLNDLYNQVISSIKVKLKWGE